MNNTRSYLDSLNAGRKRRSSTSLEELSRTLDDLENRIRRPRDDRPLERPAYGESRRDFDAPREAPRERERRIAGRDRRQGYDMLAREAQQARGTLEDRAAIGALASQLGELREEMRQQMGTGLRREFSALKDDIDRALNSTAPVMDQIGGLGAEFERLAGMVHDLAGRGDDRQLGLLRQEMDAVKGALGKLAREETLQAYDHRWDELDRRWSDIAHQASSHQARLDPALADLQARLGQIGDAIGALPTSLSVRALEDKMKVLAAAVDQFAQRQDRIGPDMLDAIDGRLDEISRAVAASAAPARQAQHDPEPFQRIEARIAALARTVAEATESRAIDIHAIDGLAGQLSSIAMRVDDLAQRVDVPDQTIDRLADQIAAIASRLDRAPQDRHLGEALAGIEHRFVELSRVLEQRHEDALAQGQSLFRDLERRLNDVALTMNSAELDGTPAPSLLIDAMDARFAELADRLDRRQPEPADDSAMRDLERRVASLSDRIEHSTQARSVDPDLIRSLESQVAALASQLAAPQPPASTGDFGPRLDRIEDAISASRSDVVETARAAAEEAMRRFSGSAAEREVVNGLVDDLKSLETLARRSDDRNARTFEAIHDTLLKIVERLGTVETERPPLPMSMPMPPAETPVNLVSTPPLQPAIDGMPIEAEHPSPKRSAAAAAAEAAADAVREDRDAAGAKQAAAGRRSLLGGLSRVLPGRKAKAETPESAAAGAAEDVRKEPMLAGDEPIDPALANRPLEPGSGAPALTAIMKRVRDERGQPARGSEADAGKADFIAAARRAAQAAAAEAEMMKRNPVSKARTGGSRLGALLKSRRKPVLMGIAAVLMALAALQAGRSLLSSGSDTVAVPAPAAIVAEAPVETLAEAKVEEQAPAAEPRKVEGELPESARTALTLPPEAPEEISTDWLETSSTLPEAEDIAGTPSAENEAEETLPETNEETLASIPAEAGPIALREAAAASDPKAYFEIANRYAEGRGVGEDMAEAAGWFEKAADAGLAPAQYRIGNMYEKGIGVERDVAVAKTWYQLAAAQGNASAMHNLAVLFAMGADGTTDNESAARWFAQAAEFGVRDSQFNLGILAAKGVGMQQDLEEAYKWFSLVAKSGDKDAAAKRDEIANALRPEQLEKARAAAELWRAKPVEPEANTVDIPESWVESQDTTASVDLKQAMRDIQSILNGNGYDAGPADGLLGRRTQAAIAAFQADNGMEATGEVDEALVRALLERR